VDEKGIDVPANGQSLGEIVVRGNVVMAGYYHDPEATERAMGDGWFHTGDAAVVHPDGYVEIRDRLKDVIISGGENISSIEVEGVLLRHPAVQEVAIVGLPDEKWGETPHAFVVLRDGGSATEEEIIAFARERLAHFKAPRGVTFVSELPKTATGKIQKYVLRKGAPNLSRQQRRLPVEGFGEVLVLEQLGLVEPEVHLVLGFLTVPGGVHEVGDGLAGAGGDGLGLVREVAADRSGLGLVRVGGADDLAYGGHRVLALEHEGDDRSALHERRGRVVDRRSQPFFQVKIVLAGEVGVDLAHLHADDLQCRILEPLDDASG
jgi:hypothetical protein